MQTVSKDNIPNHLEGRDLIKIFARLCNLSQKVIFLIILNTDILLQILNRSSRSCLTNMVHFMKIVAIQSDKSLCVDNVYLHCRIVLRKVPHN